MNFLEKLKENYQWIILGFLSILFFRQCGINRDLDKMRKSYSNMESIIDSTSLKIDNIKTIKRNEVRNEMNQVMFEFLIYEDDLDKGKISLSDIRGKIEDIKNEK